jgi:hypothetical protein
MSRGKGSVQIVRDIRDHVMRGEPWSLTFEHDVPMEVRAKVEASLKDRFRIWRETWILPRLADLEEKLTPKAKRVAR